MFCFDASAPDVGSAIPSSTPAPHDARRRGPPPETLYGRTTSKPGRAGRGSPAAGAPLGEVGAFGAERGVLAVARIEPGVVGEAVEQLVLHVVDQGREVLLVAAGVPH